MSSRIPEVASPAVALLLSTDVFEEFYGRGLGLTREAFVETYRNDWSWEYAYALRDQGVRATIYIPSERGSAVMATPEGVGIRFVGTGVVDAPWRRVRSLRRTPPGRYVHQVANALSILPELRRGFREDRITTMMVQEYWTGRWDVLSGLRLPVIGIDQGMPDRHELKTFKRRTLPRARAIVVQTSAEADKVRRHGGHPTRIPNGVDVGRYAPAPATAAGPGKEIVIVARLLDVQKRISDLIHALARLDAGWSLRILGSGPDEQMLRELAREAGVADRCRFDGFVMDRSVIVEAMRSAAVFALPSAYEGLPMSLLEAMACGCSVVGSDIPAIAEVVEHDRTGLIVGVGDVGALAEAIVEAHARRAELGAAARAAAVATYSRESCGRRLAELVVN
ncbi:glycosyltransferase [Baekduia soli]|uniref:Glycosyltransferase n=1 Tax=Baekduia soli TaxID=496014 RepID=A0A5B8U1H3_9ACTN|nr:glycosyltransferase [Baekduia soli]QEC46665.1 glycosyltransferase [Baekduia soli]